MRAYKKQHCQTTSETFIFHYTNRGDDFDADEDTGGDYSDGTSAKI